MPENPREPIEWSRDIPTVVRLRRLSGELGTAPGRQGGIERQRPREWDRYVIDTEKNQYGPKGKYVEGGMEGNEYVDCPVPVGEDMYRTLLVQDILDFDNRAKSYLDNGWPPIELSDYRLLIRPDGKCRAVLRYRRNREVVTVLSKDIPLEALEEGYGQTRGARFIAIAKGYVAELREKK